MNIGLSPLIYPWIVLGVFWLVAAARQKAAVQRQPLRERLIQILIGLLGLAMLAHAWPHPELLSTRFVPNNRTVFGIGFAIEIAGAAFALWARIALGSNWSGRPTLKLNHELITSGPYAVARHPIYTGLALAVMGTAVIIGEWRCVVGTLLIVLMFLLKIRGEEQFMMQAFPQTYPTYRKRVKALIPGVF